MRKSINQILNGVVDGEITTREQADALLVEESSEERAQIRKDMLYAAALCPRRHADKLIELFNLEER